MPYTRMMKFPHAEDILDFILDKSETGIRAKKSELRGLGRRTIDEQAFHRAIDREGVITLSTAFDEL